MDKRTLIKTLRSKRAEWDSLVTQVGESHMTEAGAAGFWSVKDVIAHLMQYERWLLDNLQALKLGESVPLYNPLDAVELDERNARIYEMHRDKPLAQVQAEARDTFDYLITAVKTLSPAELNRIYLDDKTVTQIICFDTYEHYEQHIADIEAWITKTSDA